MLTFTGEFQSEDSKIFSVNFQNLFAYTSWRPNCVNRESIKDTEETKSWSRKYWESNVFSLPLNTLNHNIITRKEYAEFKKYVYILREATYFKA